MPKEEEEDDDDSLPGAPIMPWTHSHFYGKNPAPVASTELWLYLVIGMWIQKPAALVIYPSNVQLHVALLDPRWRWSIHLKTVFQRTAKIHFCKKGNPTEVYHWFTSGSLLYVWSQDNALRMEVLHIWWQVEQGSDFVEECREVVGMNKHSLQKWT